jgi:hypothetical protein
LNSVFTASGVVVTWLSASSVAKISRYERSAGRVQFRGAEANLAKTMQRIEADKKRTDKRPYWQQALANARLPLYDVHWTPAMVVEKPGGKKGDAWRVGLADGRILPFSVDNATAQRKLTLYDVVFVRRVEGKNKGAARAELFVRQAGRELRERGVSLPRRRTLRSSRVREPCPAETGFLMPRVQSRNRAGASLFVVAPVSGRDSNGRRASLGESLHGSLTQTRWIALSLTRELDNFLRDERRDRIGAINELQCA